MTYLGGTDNQYLYLGIQDTDCQGITPSSSKGGLPAPEAGARAQEGGIRAKIDLTPSQSGGSQDKAEPR